MLLSAKNLVYGLSRKLILAFTKDGHFIIPSRINKDSTLKGFLKPKLLFVFNTSVKKTAV